MITVSSRNLDLHKLDPWNDELSAYADATIYNTLQYGAVSASLSGGKPKREAYLAEISKDGTEIGRALVFLQGISAAYSNTLVRMALRAIRPFFKQINWWQAPVFVNPRQNIEGFDSFLHWVDELSRKSGAFAVMGVTTPFYFNNYEDVLNETYEDHGYSKSMKATVTLLLDKYKTCDDYWDNIAKDARTKVRKAISDGIEIIEDDSFSFLSEFIRLQRKTDYVNFPFYRNTRLFKRLTGIYNSGNMCKLFVSIKDGEVLSGQVLFVFNKIIVLEAVVISELVRKNKWYANDLMQWYIIKWAKDNNFRLIDWGGFALSPAEKEKDINYFKLKWGGSICKFNVYSKVFIPWKYKLFKYLKNMKKISLGKIKKPVF